MGVGGRESVRYRQAGREAWETRKGRKRGIRSRKWFWLEWGVVCVLCEWWVVGGHVGVCGAVARAGEDLQHCSSAVLSRR